MIVSIGHVPFQGNYALKLGIFVQFVFCPVKKMLFGQLNCFLWMENFLYEF